MPRTRLPHKKKGAGRPKAYPYAAWIREARSCHFPEVFALRPGKEFDVTVKSMQQMLWRYMREKNVKNVTISLRNGIIYLYRKPTKRKEVKD